jgi:hypothetical protein
VNLFEKAINFVLFAYSAAIAGSSLFLMCRGTNRFDVMRGSGISRMTRHGV